MRRHAQLRFSIYLGDLGEDSHAGAQRLHDQLGPAGADSVLIAVDPQRRNVDIVTGPAARARLADCGCKLAVTSTVASFKEGDLLGGLLSGLRMLSAGIPHHSHLAPSLRPAHPSAGHCDDPIVAVSRG